MLLKMLSDKLARVGKTDAVGDIGIINKKCS